LNLYSLILQLQNKPITKGINIHYNMRVSTAALYSEAYGRKAIAAFNAFNAEQIHGIFRGAQASGCPVLIQFTPVARTYMQPAFLRAFIQAAEVQYPRVDYAVHLDHGTYEHCLAAISEGSYNSVMIDASHFDFEENVRQTREVVLRAHDAGIAVEAELGVLSGVEDHLDIDDRLARYTSPDQALEFVQRTGCDSLAVAVGTSHGAYKFSGGQGLQLDILAQIQQRLPGLPLVLHGASAVPIEEVERINLAGGHLKSDAQGIDADQLLEAIALGVCKVNIATDMRLIWTRVHREFFRDQREKFDMVVPGAVYMEELEHFVAQKCLFLKNLHD
jgi:fructose-bisphosphate aldolase, class II